MNRLTRDPSIVDDALRPQDAWNLHHLRRFVKTAYLPSYLAASEKTHPRAAIMMDDPRIKQGANSLHFLVCAASALSLPAVSTLVSSSTQGPCAVRTITVPICPPISAEQAETWSREYWPISYKKTNPYGPHHTIVARAEEEIATRVGFYMGLARAAGDAVTRISTGRNIGAVVVDRSNAQDPTVVAVAGDGRWNLSTAAIESENGNVMGHAVLRAIGFVARKRQKLLEENSQQAVSVNCPTAFADDPLTDIERNIYIRGTLRPGGYLCLDLEIYLTHEPCIMCSMAILHSRFGRVVFQERMPRTGGLTSDAARSRENTQASGLNYGLFWRPELNWKLLAWQWVLDEPLNPDLGISDVHA